jgi:hypothetical protein
MSIRSGLYIVLDTQGNNPRPIYIIAIDIIADWKKPYFGAVPYLSAMTKLQQVTDMYGEDSAKSIINYFLSNATTWRGEVARRVKKELKEMVK